MRPGNHKGKDLGIPSGLYGQDKGLYQRVWYRCSKKGMTYEQALKLEKNAPSQGGWSPEEDAAIRDCPSEDAVLTHYMNKFPDSGRTATEVTERWQQIRAKATEQTAAEAGS